MNLPKGNKLFDKQQLSVDDIKKLTDKISKGKTSTNTNTSGLGKSNVDSTKGTYFTKE